MIVMITAITPSLNASRMKHADTNAPMSRHLDARRVSRDVY
jgi:hypothetical protein